MLLAETSGTTLKGGNEGRPSLSYLWSQRDKGEVSPSRIHWLQVSFLVYNFF